MSKIVRFGVEIAWNIYVFTMVNNRRLGIGLKTALFLDKNFNPLGNVNVLSSTIVKLYREMPLCSELYFELIEDQDTL
jgi:hypothetical protein